VLCTNRVTIFNCREPSTVQGVKKTYKQQQNTKRAITNNNLSQTKHTPPQSPLWDPLSLPKGERKREQESVAETAAATDIIKLSVDDRQCRSTTSTISNALARNIRGIDEENKGSPATVTSSLFQKPVTLAAANLGSYDKSPDMADTTMDTGAIFEKGGSSKRFDPRGDGAKATGAASGRPRGNIQNI
jgi:hypothetical protein